MNVERESHPPSARRRGCRRVALAFAAAPLLLIIAAASAPWWFDARRVATLALDQAESATGLRWSSDGEPALRWRPEPWLALPGLVARDAQGRTVIAAERLELALPWATLRGETFRIASIAITAPVVDLDAAIDGWNAQPPGDGALPVLDGLRVTRGRLHWRGGALENFDLTVPRFALGEPLRATLSGRLALRGDAPAATPAPFEFSAELDATPQKDPFRLDALRIALAGTGPVPTATATGALQFTPWALTAAGEIASWPEAWPALPPPLAASPSPLTFEITQAGPPALAAEASILLRRDETRVDAALVPERLLAWLDDPAAAALPPLRASAALPRIELDGVALEGVTLELAEGDPSADDGAPRP